MMVIEGLEFVRFGDNTIRELVAIKRDDSFKCGLAAEFRSHVFGETEYNNGICDLQEFMSNSDYASRKELK